MDNMAQRLKAYIEEHPFAPGDSDYETILDQRDPRKFCVNDKV